MTNTMIRSKIGVSYPMKIISIQEIIECNRLLQENNLLFKIHLRDACGKQSCYIEPLDDSIEKESYEQMYQLLDSFFLKHRITLVYAQDKLNFWLQ